MVCLYSQRLSEDWLPRATPEEVYFTFLALSDTLLSSLANDETGSSTIDAAI